MPASRKRTDALGSSPKAEPTRLPAATPKRRTDATIDTRRPQPGPGSSRPPKATPHLSLVRPQVSQASPRDHRDAPDGTHRPFTVRWSRVKTARARIAAEYYERGDVKDRLLSALLHELLKP